MASNDERLMIRRWIADESLMFRRVTDLSSNVFLIAPQSSEEFQHTIFFTDSVETQVHEIVEASPCECSFAMGFELKLQLCGDAASDFGIGYHFNDLFVAPAVSYLAFQDAYQLLNEISAAEAVTFPSA